MNTSRNFKGLELILKEEGRVEGVFVFKEFFLTVRDESHISNGYCFNRDRAFQLMAFSISYLWHS